MKTLAIAVFCVLCNLWMCGQGTQSGGSTNSGGQTSTMAPGNVALVSIAVTPSSSTGQQNVGQSIGFTATGTLSNGATVNLTGATGTAWASSNTTIASITGISETENFLCNSAGNTQITAVYNGITGTATLVCVGVLPPVPTPVSIAISPTNPTIPVGAAGGVQYTATETYSDGSTQNVTASAQWTSGTTSVATLGKLTTTQEVDCSGTSGTSTITATHDSLSANTTQTCNPVVSSITVGPATPSIVAGNTIQLAATCSYSDGSSRTCSAPVWASTVTANATVSSTGLVSGIAAGTSTVSATLGAVSGNTVVTVTAPGPPPPTPSSVTITPSNKTININTTLQYTATLVFSDGSTQSCAATWASTATGVATINSSGLASAVGNGTTSIQGTCSSIMGSTNLTVQTPVPTLSSIAVTPANQSQYNGSSVQYTATGTYSDGSTQNLTSLATWTSSAPAVATITGHTATCVANSGSTTIQASFNSVNGTTPLACQQVTTGNTVDAYCGPSGTWIGPTTDGPASLPTACMNTDPTNNPSPGTTLGPFATTAQVQSAVNSATCGQIITVTAGSILSTITLPAKGCDSAHWITIESTGVSNGSFPAYGSRMTPCWSNVASLTGRPSYPCSSPAMLTFQMVAPASSSAILSTNADHYRIVGAEITRPTTAHIIIYSLVDLSAAGTQTNHIIFDRDWFHGVNATNFPQNSTTDTSTTRAVYLGQSNHIAIVNSYISDIYDNGSTASNGNTDAQCVGGGVGNIQLSGWGVYKFVNNHCEGASEGIILGGGGGPAPTPSGCTLGSTCTLDVPTDIEVRQNYFFRPNYWNGNTTTINTAGFPNAKNGFEFKTGARILAEGNVFENCWYNSQPYCYGFDMAPKNQSNGAGSPQCLSCLVQDFTARYQYVYNYPDPGIAIYSTMDAGCGSCTTLGRRASVHDNLFGDSLNVGSLNGNGFDCIEFLSSAGPMTNISIVHNTCINAVRSMMIFGGQAGLGTGAFAGFVFQNNLVAAGNYGVLSSDVLGCPNNNTPDNFYVFLNNCAGSSWTADHNAMFNWVTANLGATLGNLWPTDGKGAGNFFYVGTSGPQFASYGTGNSNFTPGNYQLLTASPLHNAGSDGKDIGADIVTLQQKIAGVRQ